MKGIQNYAITHQLKRKFIFFYENLIKKILDHAITHQ